MSGTKTMVDGIGRRVEIPIQTPNGKKRVPGILLMWGNDQVGTVAIVEVDGGRVEIAWPREVVFLDRRPTDQGGAS